MFHIGRARHPGPGQTVYRGQLSVEFVNVGGCLIRADLVLSSWRLLSTG